MAILCRRQHRRFAARRLPHVSDVREGGRVLARKAFREETLSTGSRPARTLGLRGGIRRVYRPSAVSDLAVLRSSGSATFPRGRFVSAVLTGRALRYAVIASLAAKYSRTILRFLRHPRGFEADAKLIGITVAGFVLVVLLILGWRQLRTYFQHAESESGAKDRGPVGPFDHARHAVLLVPTRLQIVLCVGQGSQPVLPFVLAYAIVPNTQPTLAVTAIASAPQNVTRIAPIITPAPPACAASPDR